MNKFTLAACLYVLMSIPAGAATVAYELIGSTTLKTGVFSDQPNLVTGSFVYDTSWPLQGNVYIATTGTQYGMTFDMGVLSYASTDFFGASEHDIAIANNKGGPWATDDVFTYTASNLSLPQGARFTVELFDRDGQALTSDNLPTTLDLQEFDTYAIGILWLGSNATVTDKLEFDIISLTKVNSIPIPPALWLFGSGLLGLVGMARRKAT